MPHRTMRQFPSLIPFRSPLTEKSSRSSLASPISSTGSHALTCEEKYQALASAMPDALLFVNEMIEYLYDLEKRRNPSLFLLLLLLAS